MKYAIFHFLLRLKQPFSQAARKRRMQVFLDRMEIRGGERVIDLGGAPGFWDDCPLPLDVTIVNLPGFNPEEAPPSRHELHLRIGDACNVDFAEDGSYDIAFSNSVIEHVGDKDKQREMAEEARRLAPAYWVQTPSIWFPIETHNHMPFWWFYPQSLKRYFIRRWKAKLPDWTEMIETTTVLRIGHLRDLFPDAEVWTERKFGFPKSYVLYRKPVQAKGRDT
ncbi:class I SAM-dependent methyltransferase [Roseovarius sp. E0-M6]|uniref:class I SAM-dependent methyltransferase n=1 Tax=Roseovarius sp. E0-M6 TaxID=3127118 RepID=UPI0030104A2D